MTTRPSDRAIAEAFEKVVAHKGMSAKDWRTAVRDEAMQIHIAREIDAKPVERVLVRVFDGDKEITESVFGAKFGELVNTLWNRREGREK